VPGKQTSPAHDRIEIGIGNGIPASYGYITIVNNPMVSSCQISELVTLECTDKAVAGKSVSSVPNRPVRPSSREDWTDYGS